MIKPHTLFVLRWRGCRGWMIYDIIASLLKNLADEKPRAGRSRPYVGGRVTLHPPYDLTGWENPRAGRSREWEDLVGGKTPPLLCQYCFILYFLRIFRVGPGGH